MIDRVHQVLAKLGLNEKESDIYLAILKSGSSPASVLGARTNITRSTAQYTCQQLVKKGLIRVIQQNNTFVYTAESPDKLLYLLEQEKKAINEKELEVNFIIGDLKGLRNPSAKIPKVRYFEGVAGIIDMYEDVIKSKPEKVFGMATWQKLEYPELDVYFQQYSKQRRKQSRGYAITDYLEHMTDSDDENSNRFSLYLPRKDFPIDIDMHIYSGKVAFYSLKKNQLAGVIIENEHVFRSQLTLFKAAWNFARSLPANKRYKNVTLDD